MTPVIQPSADPVATAIVIATALAHNLSYNDNDESEVRRHAELIGEIAESLLARAAERNAVMRQTSAAAV
jgi:hypothetical protein